MFSAQERIPLSSILTFSKYMYDVGISFTTPSLYFYSNNLPDRYTYSYRYKMYATCDVDREDALLLTFFYLKD